MNKEVTKHDRLSRRPSLWLKTSTWLLVLGLVLGLGVLPIHYAGLFAGQGGAGEEDRGEDPLVGSLPCLVSDDLNIMFALALGDPPQSFNLVREQTPTMAMIGDHQDLDSAIMDLWGIPLGRLNALADWTAVGLVHNGTATLDKIKVAAETVEVWQWVPAVYLGGTIEIQSAAGVTTTTLTSQSFPIPLKDFAGQLPGTVAEVTISPPSTYGGPHGDNVILVQVASKQVLVDYTP